MGGGVIPPDVGSGSWKATAGLFHLAANAPFKEHPQQEKKTLFALCWPTAARLCLYLYLPGRGTGSRGKRVEKKVWKDYDKANTKAQGAGGEPAKR